jgi:uncharacterized protein involved in exopolysaccharide biosynthesis
VADTTDRDPTFELLREDLAKTESDLAAQHATASAARRAVQSIQVQMVDLDQESMQQQDLQREAKINEDSYLLYTAKSEQERTADALDKIQIANVAIAVPPAVSVLPVYTFSMVLLVAFGAGAITGLGTAYTLDYLDTTFHSPEQVINDLGIPVVIAIPRRVA